MSSQAAPSGPLRPLAGLAAAALVAVGAADYFNNTWGPGTFLCLTLVAVAALLVLRQLHTLAAVALRRPAIPALYGNVLLLFVSLGLLAALLELGLQVADEIIPPDGAGSLAIPEEWARRPVEVEGARSAFYWHGKLHVENDERMRRSTPFPAKDESRCRILVFGDSLTYGYGVSAEEAYPGLLQSSLGQDYRVEVLNLGVSGWQSTDIADAAGRYMDELSPELAVYGVCLNDFLDSGEGEQNNRRRRAWPFPLPEKFKWELKSRTLVAGLIEERYDRLLMRLGLRLDFYEDILKDFDGYQARFGRDAARLNGTALDAGLPPVVAMVVHQSPQTTGEAWEITAVAERLMADAGMELVTAKDYFRRHDGRRLSVSPWEGHPDTEAHRIFADSLLQRLAGHPALERCRKNR